MRIVQRIFLYGISIAMIAAGVAIAAYPFSGQVVEFAHTIASKWMLCLSAGCAAAALGVFTLLPFDFLQRKGRAISFAGPTGTVSIQIEPFEHSLRKTIAKLPMVKRASVTVTPKDNNRKVGIEAAVSLKKPADASTRETAERLREFIDKVSRQILGADEVMTVDVRIEDVLVDSSHTAESLNGIFAKAEEKVVPVERSYAPAAVATAGASALAAAAMDDNEDVPAYHRVDVDAEEPEVAAEVTNDRPQSSDLLTYDEADELQHARWSGDDSGMSAEPPAADEESSGESTGTEEPGDEEPSGTSLESLGDDATDSGESQPKNEQKEFT